MVLEAFRQPLPQDYFADKQKIATRGRGRTENPRDSLVDLLNELRLFHIARGYIVDPSRDDMFQTIPDAIEQGKSEGDTNPIFILLNPMGDIQYDFSATPQLLDGERDYGFVGLGGGIADQASGRAQMTGDIDTSTAAAISLFHNRRITFDNITYSGELTLRKGRFLQVNGGLFENVKLNYVFTDAQFDGPSTLFHGTQFNNGFFFETLDLPAGFVVSQLRFIDCQCIANDSLGIPIKMGGNFGPIVDFVRCYFIVSLDGVSLFDLENTNTIIQFYNSDVYFSGNNPPGAVFANAASGRVKWFGDVNLYREWAQSSYALDLSGIGHDHGAPIVDTGVAPVGRPTGTRNRDRGATELIKVWDGAAWV
jgi:hypothetical protein